MDRIEEGRDAVIVSLEDAPEDVTIDVHDRAIDIYAVSENLLEAEDTVYVEEAKFHHIDLPADLDLDGISCSYHNGRLEITIPRVGAPGGLGADLTDVSAPEGAVGFASVEDRPDEVVVHMDIEDADPERVTIDVREDGMDIVASMTESIELEEAVIEEYGVIHRHVDLPPGLDTDAMSFSYEDGHLDISLPRMQ
jgi:HSP20 family molecular chaperone IbpA